jgi:hypothetical protein
MSEGRFGHAHGARQEWDKARQEKIEADREAHRNDKGRATRRAAEKDERGVREKEYDRGESEAMTIPFNGPRWVQPDRHKERYPYLS